MNGWKFIKIVGGRRAKAYAVSMLWLLLASAFVTVVSPHSPSASGFQAAGQFASTVIGQTNFTSRSSSLAPESLNRPFRSAFDSHADLWVADENNHRVVEFEPPFIDGEAASVEIGQPNFTASIPTSVEIASYPQTRSSLFGPVSIAFDRSGDLWVSDFVDSRVTEYVPPFTNGMNASLELGQPAGDLQFVTHTPRAPNVGLAAPLDLAFDSSGNLWVADRGNNRVVEYTPPFIDGGLPSRVIGQASLNASISSTTQNGLNAPESIAFDASGNLWVVDQQNNRVVKFNVSSLVSDGPNAAVEMGQPEGTTQFFTNASGRSQSSLDAPVGIAFGPSGDMLISDRANNRILGFNPPFVDGMNASFEIGQPGGPAQFTTGVASLSQDNLDNPLGIAFDATGNLWVADQINGRMLEFSGTATATSGSDAVVSDGGAAISAATTGVTVSLRGVSSGSLVNIYTSDLAVPPDTRSPGLAQPAFYQVKASGASGNSATICISNQNVSGSTDIRFFGGDTWTEASGINRTADVSICGGIPPPEFSGLLLIAIGSPVPTSGTLPAWQLGALLAVSAVILAGVTYLELRRRRPGYHPR